MPSLATWLWRRRCITTCGISTAQARCALSRAAPPPQHLPARNATQSATHVGGAAYKIRRPHVCQSLVPAIKLISWSMRRLATARHNHTGQCRSNTKWFMNGRNVRRYAVQRSGATMAARPGVSGRRRQGLRRAAGGVADAARAYQRHHEQSHAHPLRDRQPLLLGAQREGDARSE